MRIQLTKDSDFLRDDRFDTKVDKSIRRGYVYKGLLPFTFYTNKENKIFVNINTKVFYVDPSNIKFYTKLHDLIDRYRGLDVIDFKLDEFKLTLNKIIDHYKENSHRTEDIMRNLVGGYFKV